MRVSSVVLAALLPLLGLFATAAAHADDLERAREAVRAENFEEAVALLTPLAEAGQAQAQAGLGTLYAAGRGVEQDEARAARLFRQAADQGNALGQFNLGVFYLHGRGGVGKDSVEALKWVSLAAVQGVAEAKQLHVAIASTLTRPEREEGKRRAREWKAP